MLSDLIEVAVEPGLASSSAGGCFPSGTFGGVFGEAIVEILLCSLVDLRASFLAGGLEAGDIAVLEQVFALAGTGHFLSIPEVSQGGAVVQVDVFIVTQTVQAEDGA